MIGSVRNSTFFEAFGKIMGPTGKRSRSKASEMHEVVWQAI